MKLKTCEWGEHDLPITEFTSTRARFCINCTRLRLIKMEQKRQQKYIDRLTTKKQKTKTVLSIADLKKKVQRVFNAWIRERDKYMPCISCGATQCDSWQAGHFWSMGSNGSLRYNENNCHKQCVSCNVYKSGNLLEYRFNLIKKIGTTKLDWLDNNRHETKKWNREELLELLEKYKQIRK